MLRCLRAGTAGLVLCATVLVRGAVDVDLALSRRLIDAALSGHAYDYTRGLTEGIGARLTGTAAYERAARWAADRFREAGVSAVDLEPFTLPTSWRRQAPARARILSPVEQPLVVESVGWSPSTPDDGVAGEVAVVSAREPLDRVRGRVVLVAGEGARNFDVTLKNAGALALLIPDGDPDNRLSARVLRYGGDVAALPVAMIAREDAARIRQLVGGGQTVRLSLAMRNAVSAGPVTVHNVVAEITGRERPDEWVLAGAHLDSWDFATGAQDNAVGAAMVLEAARAIASLGRAPRRSIRFALWGGEEQGLLGSSAYVAAHDADLTRAVAVLNADGGTGRMVGWTTPGRDDVMAVMQDLAAAVLGGLGSAAVDRSMRYAFDSDGGPFIRQGVPVLDLNVDDSDYEAIHHKTTDTLDRVNARNLAIGAATVAATAYAIADAPERIARRGPPVRPR